MVEDKPTLKRYEKKLNHKKKINKFSHYNESNLTLKKGTCFVFEKSNGKTREI